MGLSTLWSSSIVKFSLSCWLTASQVLRTNTPVVRSSLTRGRVCLKSLRAFCCILFFWVRNPQELNWKNFCWLCLLSSKDLCYAGCYIQTFFFFIAITATLIWVFNIISHTLKCLGSSRGGWVFLQWRDDELGQRQAWSW